MIQNFADLALSGDRRSRAGTVAAATTTQHYLDAVWAEIASPHFSNPLAICQVEPMSSGRGGVWVTSRWSGPGLIV